MAGENKPARAPVRPGGASRRRRAGRGLSRGGLISLALHLAVVASVVLAALHRPAHPPPPQREVRVALVLKEQKGAGPPHAPSPPAPRPPPPAPVPAPAPPRPATPAPTTRQAVPPPPKPAKAPRPPSPPAPPARPAFQFNLGGTNSQTNAIVRGSAVVPAKPDARFRNLEPVYPDAAAERGEQGTVMLLIHVTPNGTASQVDVLHSSGFRLLDRAAQQAVARWHFLPAVRDGQAVAASMPLRVVFSLH